MSAAATAVVAAIAAEQKKLRDLLADKRAFDPTSAIEIAPPGKPCGSQVRHLVQCGHIAQTSDGRYYLTRKGREKQEEVPPSLARVMLIILALGLMIGTIVGIAVILS